MTFMDKFIAGQASADDIDEHIEGWHRGSSRQSLSQHLGLSDLEYWRWVRDPDALPAIVRDRSR
jgi:hypothetical protein